MRTLILNIRNIESVYVVENTENENIIEITCVSKDKQIIFVEKEKTFEFLKIIHYAIGEGRGALYIEIGEGGFIKRAATGRVEY